MKMGKKKHPLQKLHCMRLGDYFLHVALRPSSKTGWTRFSLYLSRSKRKQDALILEGIHSKGGKGVKAWIEIGDYFPLVQLKSGHGPARQIDLRKDGLDRALFHSLSRLIPPGGHLMFAYEVSYESRFHEDTRRSLRYRIPPICTAQGELLFRSGFRLIKNWYLAEGGHEGPNKLWGEKPLNRSEKKVFDERTFSQILSYLSTILKGEILALEHEARIRALGILKTLRPGSDLSSLQKKIT
jgi:hypothetical protein